MNLQTTFYTMGIIFMAISFIFLIALIALLLYIKRKVTKLHKNIEKKIEVATTLKQAGSKVIEITLDKVKELIQTKK